MVLVTLFRHLQTLMVTSPLSVVRIDSIGFVFNKAAVVPLIWILYAKINEQLLLASKFTMFQPFLKQHDTFEIIQFQIYFQIIK